LRRPYHPQPIQVVVSISLRIVFVVAMSDTPYYLNCKREEAEEILSQAPHGSFILRPSTVAGAVAMSIREGGGIEHALIVEAEHGVTVQLSADHCASAPTVTELIESLIPSYLKPNPIAIQGASDGQPVTVLVGGSPPPLPDRSSSLGIIAAIMQAPSPGDGSSFSDVGLEENHEIADTGRLMLRRPSVSAVFPPPDTGPGRTSVRLDGVSDRVVFGGGVRSMRLPDDHVSAVQPNQQEAAALGHATSQLLQFVYDAVDDTRSLIECYMEKLEAFFESSAGQSVTAAASRTKDAGRFARFLLGLYRDMSEELADILGSQSPDVSRVAHVLVVVAEALESSGGPALDRMEALADYVKEVPPASALGKVLREVQTNTRTPYVPTESMLGKGRELLEELVLYTDQLSHAVPGFAELDAAVGAVARAVHASLSEATEGAKARRIAQVRALLIDSKGGRRVASQLADNARLLLESFNAQDTKSTYTLMLFSDRLLVLRPKAGRLEPVMDASVADGFTVRRSTKVPFGIEIRHRRKTFDLELSSPEEVEQWLAVANSDDVRVSERS